jgi:hypothetical protein
MANMQRTLDLHYDKLVIGADLSALSYAYVHKIPIVYLRKLYPHQYCILGNFDYEIDLYKKLMFILSVSNHNPFSESISAIRLEENNRLKIITKNNLIVNLTFNYLIISDDYHISGLPVSIEATNNNNCVVDWFNIACGAIHNVDKIETKDEFCNNIIFYLSKRSIYTNKDKKDCVAVSNITTENLNSFDYSHLIVSFKVKKEMKDIGLRGKWDKTNNKFKPVKLVFTKREVHNLWKNLYKDLPENISILTDNHKDILSNLSKEDKYISFLMEKYGISI